MAKPNIDVNKVKYVMLRMKKTYYDDDFSRVSYYENLNSIVRVIVHHEPIQGLTECFHQSILEAKMSRMMLCYVICNLTNEFQPSNGALVNPPSVKYIVKDIEVIEHGCPF